MHELRRRFCCDCELLCTGMFVYVGTIYQGPTVNPPKGTVSKCQIKINLKKKKKIHVFELLSYQTRFINMHSGRHKSRSRSVSVVTQSPLLSAISVCSQSAPEVTRCSED